MAARPRKTSELRDSSTKKPRASRIAQPIRRPSVRDSGHRSNSLEPDCNRNPFVHSATKQRSTSALRNSATPLHTPLKPIPFPSNVMFTSEKALADDKKWIQAQVNRLNDYVKQYLPDISKDLSSKGGIKSMTTRQFINIISHLISLAAGNKFKISNNTYIDDIIKILPQLEYPYNLNKSSLKSINAPHSFGHIVVLLSWFLDFANPESSVNEVEDEKYLVDWENDFPSASYTKYFIDHAKNGFLLWNNSDDIEYNNHKSRLIDNFISLKTDMRFKNRNEIEQHMDVINAEYKMLIKNKIIIKNEMNLNDLINKCNLIELNINKIKHYISEKNLQIKSLKRNIHDNHEIINELKDQLGSLELTVKTQKMNVTERNNKMNEITMKNLLINTKIKTINDLEDMSSSNQITYSRLIKKKLDLITTLYNLLIKLELKLVNFREEITHLIEKFNNNFKTNSNTSKATSKIQLLVVFLGEVEKLNAAFLEEQNYYNEQSRNLQIELSELKNNNSILAEDVNRLNNKLEIVTQFNQSQLEKVLNDIVESNKELNELNVTLINKTNNIKVYKKLIENNLVVQNQLMQSIEELKREAVTNGDRIMEEKEKKLLKLQSTFKEIDELFEEIDFV